MIVGPAPLLAARTPASTSLSRQDFDLELRNLRLDQANRPVNERRALLNTVQDSLQVHPVPSLDGVAFTTASSKDHVRDASPYSRLSENATGGQRRGGLRLRSDQDRSSWAILRARRPWIIPFNRPSAAAQIAKAFPRTPYSNLGGFLYLINPRCLG